LKLYEPAEGSGWEEGCSMFPETIRRWRTPLEGGVYLTVTTCFPNAQFVVSRAKNDMREHELPQLEDLARVQKDFGVEAWTHMFPMPSVNPRASGGCLVLRAMEDPS
jgi:hypothetical protein